MFCGWDWGSTAHGVCLIDDHGAVVRKWMVQHTEDQLRNVFDELAQLVEGGDVGQVPIAIERGEGLVVGLIAGAGHPVWMVEPAAFKAARPRWGSAGAKSDLGDAFMLADYARTDGHRLRRIEPVQRATRELAALVRARSALVVARTAASNQLWAILAEHWPGAAVVFQKLTSQIALAFLTDYPTPQAAALLGERRMGQFCRRHSYRGGKTPAELIRRLRAAPASANPIAPTILTAIVRGSTAQIRLLNTEITRLEADIAGALAAHPKTPLLQTLPRVATVSLAALIAEIGPLLERCDNPEQVAAMCGAAPVTRASGKSRTVGFRYTANKPARVAITGFADNSRHSSAWAADAYRRARARGARHPHAVRILARSWIRVIWACWNTDTTYDPLRHRSEQLITAAT
ncbi:MAG TPA: IS110 family transposase [Streptosporangiaceae bacterium]|nr:IS110 family transposase [Streptosporangiaceae bacterium]